MLLQALILVCSAGSLSTDLVQAQSLSQAITTIGTPFQQILDNLHLPGLLTSHSGETRPALSETEEEDEGSSSRREVPFHLQRASAVSEEQHLPCMTITSEDVAYTVSPNEVPTLGRCRHVIIQPRKKRHGIQRPLHGFRTVAVVTHLCSRAACGMCATGRAYQECHAGDSAIHACVRHRCVSSSHLCLHAELHASIWQGCRKRCDSIVNISLVLSVKHGYGNDTKSIQLL